MNKTLLGLLFIFAGLLYGSLAVDGVYKHTLGYLVEHGWIKLPVPDKNGLPSLLGRKPTILFYSLILILIGLFLIWNRDN